MKKNHEGKGWIALLAAFFGIGLVLRFYGINAPYPWLQVDEVPVVESAVLLWDGTLPVIVLGWPGCTLLFLLSFCFFVQFCIMRAPELISALASKDMWQITGVFEWHIAEFFGEGQWAYVLGRSVNVLISLAAMYVVYRIARDGFKSRKAGFFAVALLAVNPLIVEKAHFLVLDTIAAFFSLAALAFAIKTAQEGRRRWYLISWAFYGMAMASKLTAGPLLVPLLYSLFAAPKAEGAPRRALLWNLLGGFAVGAVAFLVCCPYALNHTISMAYSMMRNVYGEVVTGVSYMEHISIGWVYLLVNLVKGTWGPLCGILGLLGVAWAVFLRLKGKADRVLFVYLLSFWIIVGYSRNIHDRWLATPIFVLALFAGKMLGDLFDRLGERKKAGAYALVLVFFALLLVPGLQSYEKDRSYYQGNSLWQARDWFLENLPAGTRYISTFHPTRNFLPPSEEEISTYTSNYLELLSGGEVESHVYPLFARKVALNTESVRMFRYQYWSRYCSKKPCKRFTRLTAWNPNVIESYAHMVEEGQPDVALVCGIRKQSTWLSPLYAALETGGTQIEQFGACQIWRIHPPVDPEKPR